MRPETAPQFRGLQPLHVDGYGRYLFALACSIVPVLLWIRMEGGNRQLESTLLPPILIPAIAGSFVFLKVRRFWIGAGAFVAAAALVLAESIIRLTPLIAPDAFSPVAVGVMLYVALPTLFLVSAGFTFWVIFCFRLAHRSLGLPVVANALAGLIPVLYFAAVFSASSITGVPAKVFLDEYGRRYALTTLALRRRDPRLCLGDAACERVLEFTADFPANCGKMSPSYMRSTFPFALWVHFDFSRCARADAELIESTFDDDYAVNKLMHRRMRTEMRNDADCSLLGAAAGAGALATCQALVRGDGAACGQQPNEARSECLLSLAIRHRDGRFCSARYRNFEDASCFILVELANQELVK